MGVELLVVAGAFMVVAGEILSSTSSTQWGETAAAIQYWRGGEIGARVAESVDSRCCDSAGPAAGFWSALLRDHCVVVVGGALMAGNGNGECSLTLMGWYKGIDRQMGRGGARPAVVGSGILSSIIDRIWGSSLFPFLLSLPLLCIYVGVVV